MVLHYSFCFQTSTVLALFFLFVFGVLDEPVLCKRGATVQHDEADPLLVVAGVNKTTRVIKVGPMANSNQPYVPLVTSHIVYTLSSLSLEELILHVHVYCACVCRFNVQSIVTTLVLSH